MGKLSTISTASNIIRELIMGTPSKSIRRRITSILLQMVFGIIQGPGELRNRSVEEMEAVKGKFNITSIHFFSFIRKTAGRGHKGTYQRAGGSISRGFEGG